MSARVANIVALSINSANSEYQRNNLLLTRRAQHCQCLPSFALLRWCSCWLFTFCHSRPAKPLNNGSLVKFICIEQINLQPLLYKRAATVCLQSLITSSELEALS